MKIGKLINIVQIFSFSLKHRNRPAFLLGSSHLELTSSSPLDGAFSLQFDVFPHDWSLKAFACIMMALITFSRIIYLCSMHILINLGKCKLDWGCLEFWEKWELAHLLVKVKIFPSVIIFKWPVSVIWVTCLVPYWHLSVWPLISCRE